MSEAARKYRGLAAWHIYAGAAVVCAALTGGAYQFGVEPAMARRGEHAAARADLARRQDEARSVAAELADARRLLAATKADVTNQPLRLEPATMINHRLARLATLATEVGLVVDEMQPGAAVDGKHYQVVPVRISGTGGYTTCARFLHEVRARFPDTAVKSFACNNPNNPAEAPAGKFKVELAWHATPSAPVK